MSLYDDVDREALHDWLNERDALAADERPDPSEYEGDVCWECEAEIEDRWRVLVLRAEL